MISLNSPFAQQKRPKFVFDHVCGIIHESGGKQMDFKAGVFVKVLLPAAFIAVLSGAASAEVVKGTVKTIAKELKALTLQTSQESVFFIVWDNKTAWNGIDKPAEINPDEAVTVDIRQDQAVAASISRIKPIIPDGVTTLSLDKLEESLKNSNKTRTFVLVDTRPADLFERAHILGALSVPLSRLEKQAFGRLPENKAAGLVFYDEGQGGESAAKGAELAVKAGFTDVSVLGEGAAGWKSSGRPLASAARFLRKSKPVVIDLRKPELVAQGHIEGAVNFPVSELKMKYGHFPMKKQVPIVLYGESDSEAGAAAATIRKWGYRNVTIFSGGAEAWLNGAEVLQTGPAELFITDTSIAHGGQLSPKDFEMALISPGTVEIVDARSAAEHEKGSFPKAIKIPLQDLPKRHGELNKEMIQVVFGSNPEYAEMAYDLLKSNGYRVNYLNGTVEFGKQGKYTVK
jgi:rhodanese-related sulfurtransferase